MAISPGGTIVYVLLAGDPGLSAYQVQSDGRLTSVPMAAGSTALPVGVNGLAIRKGGQSMRLSSFTVFGLCLGWEFSTGTL